MKKIIFFSWPRSGTYLLKFLLENTGFVFSDHLSDYYDFNTANNESHFTHDILHGHFCYPGNYKFINKGINILLLNDPAESLISLIKRQYTFNQFYSNNLVSKSIFFKKVNPKDLLNSYLNGNFFEKKIDCDHITYDEYLFNIYKNATNNKNCLIIKKKFLLSFIKKDYKKKSYFLYSQFLERLNKQLDFGSFEILIDKINSGVIKTNQSKDFKYFYDFSNEELDVNEIKKNCKKSYNIFNSIKEYYE